MVQTRSASTALNKHKGLQQFFRWLVEEGDTTDRQGRTAPATASFLARFEMQVDPLGVLDPETRAKWPSTPGGRTCRNWPRSRPEPADVRLAIKSEVIFLREGGEMCSENGR